MHELHWRVADFDSREWKQGNEKTPAVKKMLDEIDAYIELKIEENKTNPKKHTMLNSFLTSSANLSLKEVKNLCWTFLTMGHDNVGSSLVGGDLI